MTADYCCSFTDQGWELKRGKQTMTHKRSFFYERRGAHTYPTLWRAIDRTQVCSASDILSVAERKSMPRNESISYIKPKQTTVSPKWEISQPFQCRERKWRRQPEGKRKKHSKWAVWPVKALVQLVLFQDPDFTLDIVATQHITKMKP